MILVLIGLFMISFFVSFVLIRNKTKWVIYSLISFVGIVLSLTLLVQNDKYHFGMKKVETITTKKVYSPLPKKTPIDLLMYKQVGTSGKDNVYLYKNNVNDKKVKNTETDGKTTNVVSYTNTKNAVLETKITRYKYASNFSKLLFGLNDNETLVSRENKFVLPKNDWLTISTKNAKKLASLGKKQTQEQKLNQQKAGKMFVETKVKQAIMQDPSLMTDKVKQQQIIDNATKDFTKSTFSKTINNLEK